MASEHRPRPHTAPPSVGASEKESGEPTRPRRSRPGGKLRLPRRRPLREAMLLAFSRILGAARRAAHSAAADPVAAVHEYRKSLRRARALIAVLSPSLGKKATRGFVRRLRAAFRPTSALRDADVLLATLRAVPAAAEDDLERHAIEVALELEQRRSLAETAEILAPGVRSLATLPGALEVTLDPEFSTRDLERGFTRSRRRERRSLERARETQTDEDLHAWRKRVKELRYQVELLASTGSRELKKREKALGELAQELGDVTDLILLEREIARRERSGEIPATPGLRDRIQKIARAQSPKIRERGESLFEDNPRLFARQVIAERG